MNTGEDVAYKNALRGKKYMMGVSPYFYTSTSTACTQLVYDADVNRSAAVEQELVLIERVPLV